MAMVLSSQSRLLVALCFGLLLMAGALAVGSLTGWFQKGSSTGPKQARLSQVLYMLIVNIHQHHFSIIHFLLLSAFIYLSASSASHR